MFHMRDRVNDDLTDTYVLSARLLSIHVFKYVEVRILIFIWHFVNEHNVYTAITDRIVSPHIEN